MPQVPVAALIELIRHGDQMSALRSAPNIAEIAEQLPDISEGSHNVVPDIMSAVAPVVAMGIPLVGAKPEKATALLDTASVVAAVPGVQNLLTKAIKSTTVYQSLPDHLKRPYIQKVLPDMLEHFISTLSPVVMLQLAKHVGMPEESPKSTAFIPMRMR